MTGEIHGLQAIIGLGFRREASADAIEQALTAAIAASPAPVTTIATAHDKAESPALVRAARAVLLPIHAIPTATLAAADTGCLTRSAMVTETRGVGSLAEAAALACAAGLGETANVKLTGPRQISPDHQVTTAIALVAPIRKAPCV